MPFKSTYDEIIAMIRKAVLDIRMCRAIMRRAGAFPQSGVLAMPEVRGTFAEVTEGNLTGYANFYPPGETEFYFPDSSESMAVSRDFTGLTQARIFTSQTASNNTGSMLTVAFDETEFIATPPAVPMDDPGLFHISEWCEFTPTGEDVLRWILTNPSGLGGEAVGFVVGLCQIQFR